MIENKNNVIEKYKKNKLVQTNFYIDPEDKIELEKLSEDHGINFSELVRIILRNFLEKKKNKNHGDKSNDS